MPDATATTSATQAAVIAAYGSPLRSLEMRLALRDAAIPALQALVSTGRLNAYCARELSRLPAAAQTEVVALGPAACRSVARELRNLREGHRCPHCGLAITPRKHNTEAAMPAAVAIADDPAEVPISEVFDLVRSGGIDALRARFGSEFADRFEATICAFLSGGAEPPTLDC